MLDEEKLSKAACCFGSETGERSLPTIKPTNRLTVASPSPQGYLSYTSGILKPLPSPGMSKTYRIQADASAAELFHTADEDFHTHAQSSFIEIEAGVVVGVVEFPVGIR